MPHSHTIERARFVATSMSFPAPVVFWPKTISSAMRPPIRIAIWLSANSWLMLSRSSCGSCCVRPSARPRGMIVTLWSGIGAREDLRDERVAGLVDGGRPLLLLGDDIERRSVPMSTLSFANSKSSIASRSLFRRAA